MFNISRTTAHKYIERYEKYGLPGLLEKSRATCNVPNKTPDRIEKEMEKQIQNVNKMFEDENSVLMKTLGIKRDSIVNKFIKIGKPVFVVLGNHDKINWTTNAPVYNIHQKYVDYQGYRFIGYRYTLMEKSEKEIEEDLKRIIPYINEKTILVTHSPPYGILDKTNKGDKIGSKAIRDIITKYKLKLHVFGHVHEDYGNLKNMINAPYFVERKFVSVNIS